MFNRTPVILLLPLALFAAACESGGAGGQASRSESAAVAAACGMQLTQGAAAFCETFDQPSAVTNRSGQLDGTLWGASRLTGATNFGQGMANTWLPSTIDACGGSRAAQPDGTDIVVCNGQLRESSNDGSNVTTLALYPKQPFDFSGRTGTVAFDVTNDTLGSHDAWPEFWITDQPVPAPFTHGGPACDFCSVPRNALGIRLSASFGPGQGGQAPNCPSDANRHWTIDSMVVVRNYVLQEVPMLTAAGWRTSGCATTSSGPNGALNHVEVRVSQQQVEVWGTDAGGSTLKLLARSANMNLSFTRGLVWIEDSHYNANKAGGGHSNHTFTWDNVAFDGPVVARDLSFDVLDRLGPSAAGLNLGWITSPQTPVQLSTLPMTAANIAAAQGALLMFNYSYIPVSTFSYRINGHAFSAPVPFNPGTAWVMGHSVALPVPLNALVPGAQQITLAGDVVTAVANVNIVLVGAGGGGGGAPPPPTPPTVSISTPVEGATVSGTVTVSASASDALGVAGVQFQVDGANNGAEVTAAPFSLALDTTALPNGAHALTAAARNTAGVFATSAPVHVTVTNAPKPPTVSITSPANGASLTGVVTIVASASDAVAVAGVQFQLDGAALGTEDTAAPYQAALDTTPLPDGTHVLTAVARNSAGLTATSVPVSVTVTHPPALPVISSFTATPTVVDVGQATTLAWAVTGAGAIAIDHGVGTVAASGSQAVTPAATTTYTITATSAAGAVSRAVTVSVRTPVPPGACRVQLNQGAIAFCETFDQPFAVTNRSGQLNGTLWGASRVTGATNFGQGMANTWAPSTIDACGRSLPAQPDGTDLLICNGQLRESSNDGSNVTTLALYPKQPFDFAGRTGTVAFDVSNDTLGSHDAWPEFWISDQPVPAPFTHGGPPCDFCSVPRNALGIRLSASFGPGQGGQAPNCPPDANRHWTIDSMVVVRNYVVQEVPMLTAAGWQTSGCVTTSSGPNGALNHVEVRVSQQQVEVWGTDAGSTTLKLLARSANMNLSFTRGLVWIEDSHYNANKAGGGHGNHTFAWDNVAFDGPVIARDLSFDVLDHLTPSAAGLNLGWITFLQSPVQLSTLPMTADNIAAAQGALLMFNYSYVPVSTFSYSINGHAFSAPVPFNPGTAWVMGRSVALPVPLTALVPGAQQITLAGDTATAVANVNIVLVAAGGVVLPP